MDRLRGGGTTGVGAEIANAEAERESKKEGGVGVNEGGRHNCCYPWWIHTTNEGGTDFTQRATERGSQVPKGDGNKGMEKGLTIHKDTGWRSPVVAG